MEQWRLAVRSLLIWIYPPLAVSQGPSSNMTVLCFMLQTACLALQARQGWSRMIPWDQGAVGERVGKKSPIGLGLMQRKREEMA